MGYELWTSPLTGYRRHGTRLVDFNAAMGARTLAKDICEPLKCCPSGAPADEMRAELMRLDFTVAGVRDVEGGAVTGYVRASDLTEGPVFSQLRPLSDLIIIDDERPIQELLMDLRDAPFVFVRLQAEVSAILTWADLNKPVVRMYIFGLISLLEMHVSFWISRTYDDESWRTALSDARLEAAKVVQQKRAMLGQDLPLIQCLQMSDKRELVVKSDDIRARLDLGSKKASTKLFKEIEKLRDALAHSQYELAVGNRWCELLAVVESMQRIISSSDDRVEGDALQRSANFASLLW